MTGDIDNVRTHCIENNRRVVFTNGCFDLLHPGHVKSLEFAKNYQRNIKQNILIVGINSDSSVKKLKGDKRPIYREYWRTYIVNSLEFVDYTIVFDEVSVLNLIYLIRPDILVKGETTHDIVGKDFVESYGGIVLKSPVVGDGEKAISTSYIINRIKNL